MTHGTSFTVENISVAITGPSRCGLGGRHVTNNKRCKMNSISKEVGDFYAIYYA